MDATIQRPSVEELSDAIIEKLSQAGQLAKLAHANLETIEREVLENMDQITTRVISELLGRQAELAQSPTACPRCHGPLHEKPPQGRLLQSKRGSVSFRCEVYHCEACRLDFFPSVPNAWL